MTLLPVTITELLNSDKLTTHELQFGFQKLASTTMCSLGVNSVVDYYNIAGRAIYACVMDLRKPFDLVSWEVLFCYSQSYWRGVFHL